MVSINGLIFSLPRLQEINNRTRIRRKNIFAESWEISAFIPQYYLMNWFVCGGMIPLFSVDQVVAVVKAAALAVVPDVVAVV